MNKGRSPRCVSGGCDRGARRDRNALARAIRSSPMPAGRSLLRSSSTPEAAVTNLGE